MWVRCGGCRRREGVGDPDSEGAFLYATISAQNTWIHAHLPLQVIYRRGHDKGTGVC